MSVADGAAVVSISVTDPHDSSLRERALSLCQSLSIPLVEDASCGSALTLWVSPRGLSLGPSGPSRKGDICVDFLGGGTGYRRVASGGKRQPLARALGVHKGIRYIADATAGLGRDALLLASMGCRVLAMERNLVLCEMLADAQDRALHRGNTKLRGIMNLLTFVKGDSSALLESLSGDDIPEAVYIDPMYPARIATALVKKEMRVLRFLVGDDLDASVLLEVARRVATKRVIVKRHPRATPLAPGSVGSHNATRVRYDVYLPVGRTS